MNSYLKIVICLLFGTLCLNVEAQRIKKLTGEYISLVRSNETPEEAKKRILNAAILKAMADEFGTLMTESGGAIISNKNGNSEIDFSAVSESVVQGELVNIVDEPEYKFTYPDNELWCEVKVTFRARKRVIKNSEIEAKIYRKGPNDKSSNIGVESSDFLSGDQLIMSFRASADGYLAIYLVEGDEAFCLLPYRNDDDGKFFVKQGEEYILFSRDKNHYSQNQKGNGDVIEAYEMTSNRSVSQNVIHVLFSPEEFSKALDKKDDKGQFPSSLSQKEFQEWVGKCRTRDPQLQHVPKHITVKRRD